jgi:hypothetical protein
VNSILISEIKEYTGNGGVCSEVGFDGGFSFNVMHFKK